MSFQVPDSPSLVTVHAPRPRAAQAAETPLLLLLAGALLLPAVVTYYMATSGPERVTAVVVGVLGLVVIAARPFWGMVFFLGLLYTRPEESIPELAGLRFTFLVAVATLVSSWFYLFLKRERPVWTAYTVLLVGFTASVVLASVGHGHIAESATEITKILVLVLLVLNLVRDPDRYRWLINTLLLFTLYLSLFSIYRFYQGLGAVDEGGTLLRAEATGIFGDPNDLAASINGGLALLIARFLRQRGAMRWWYSAMGLTFIFAVLLTQSRGALASLVVLLLAYAMPYLRRRPWVLGVAGLALLALLAAAPGRMMDFDSLEESANQRFWYWTRGVSWFLETGMLGIGYGQFAELNVQVAHNSFVQCFAELGIFGYFCWLGALYLGFRPLPRPDLPAGEREVYDSELLGARIALLTYLASAFWISRTYVPNLFIFATLPVVAHVAFRRTHDPYHFRARDWTKEGGRILALCFGSILFIKLFAESFR